MPFFYCEKRAEQGKSCRDFQYANNRRPCGNTKIKFYRGKAMFRYLKKIWLSINEIKRNVPDTPADDPTDEEQPISRKLQDNLKIFKGFVGDSADIIIREFTIGKINPVDALLIYVDGLVNTDIVNSHIMKSLMLFEGELLIKAEQGSVKIGELMRSVIYSGEMQEIDNFKQIIDSCLYGDAVLLVDGLDKGLDISTKGWEKRSVSEPQTESVVRGPREGFTENMRTNTSLLRRKLRTPALRMDHMNIGKKTFTSICVCYLEGVADPEVITTIKQRLSNIDTDSILETGYIEQYIEDAPYSIFSTMAYSEKPDVTAAKMLEGRVAIMVDGTPFVLTAPMLFLEHFQSAEDYYTKPFHSNLIRLLRYLAFFIACFGPALYIAFSTYHQELIPTTLLFTMAESREGIPFPAFIETLLMVITFEILSEAGLRMPKPIGQAVSIVGALVVGEAAVSAGFVGAPIVIVIAITAVSGFIVPTLLTSISILRLIFIVLSTAMGGYGILIGFLGMLVHLASLRSFGVPYMGYIAPTRPGMMKDVFTRTFLWKMHFRPHGLAKGDTTRQQFQYPPVPEDPQDDKNDDSKGE